MSSAQAQTFKDPALEALLSADRFDELQRVSAARVATQPDDAQAVLGLALAALERDDAAARLAAIRRAEACIDKQPKAAPCHYALGATLGVQALSEGMMKMARSLGSVKEALTQAHTLEPDWYAARSALIEFHLLAPGMMGGSGGSGPGIGGMLATGAAAAAGAYLGNRMAGGGHETMGNGLEGQQTAGQQTAGQQTAGQQTAGLGGLGAGAAGVGGAGLGAGAVAGDDYFSNRDGAAAVDNQAPDYFSNDNTAADAGSGDYFSGDDNSSSSAADDTSSADTGGGGFDGGGGGDDSGSW